MCVKASCMVGMVWCVVRKIRLGRKMDGMWRERRRGMRKEETNK